jgi:mono/diheme cytochrome c family protein
MTADSCGSGDLSMKSLLTTMLAVGALVIAAGTAAAQDAKIEQGKKVYADQKCSMCHSIEGKGNVKGALDSVGSRLGAAEIRQWVVDPKTMTAKTNAERKPPMKAYPNLPADELDALVAYLQSLKKK